MFDFECCPNTALGTCGGPIRGDCDSVKIVEHCQNQRDSNYGRVQQFLESRPGTGRIDFRYKWPTQIFQRVCVCKGNYGGYNCMRCKRGFTGDDCSKPISKEDAVSRKNILSLNEAERQRFISIIQMTKSVRASGYTVPIREPVTTVPRESFVEVSLYDIFATFHYNSIRDEQINKCPSVSPISRVCNDLNKCEIPDFAHQGPAFLTWHRGYLLFVETEIQEMLNDPTFALPYWDWTDEDKRDEIWDLLGTSDCGTFSTTGNTKTKEAEIDGPFHSWDIICTRVEDIVCNVNNQVCNPTENYGETGIQRCIGGIQGIQCRVDKTLPSMEEVDIALKEQVYDMSLYNIKEDHGGFRNALEGFKKLVDRNSTRDVCSHVDDVMFRITELHNKVHLYIGGTMLSVPMASNDPIFFLHHCNVDRLYEQWLGKDSSGIFPSYQPRTSNCDIAPGHNIDEFLVPMFPLITNGEMHNKAESFGYTYNGCMGRSQMVCQCHCMQIFY